MNLEPEFLRLRDFPEEYDQLSDAIFAMYAVIAKRIEAEPPKMPELERRKIALRRIGEILSWQPFSAFSATHLELLELLIAYWRELEVEGEPRAPEPDPAPRLPERFAYVEDVGIVRMGGSRCDCGRQFEPRDFEGSDESTIRIVCPGCHSVAFQIERDWAPDNDEA